MSWDLPFKQRKTLEKLNAETAQAYQRLENRLRAEPDPDPVWTQDDLRYLRQWRISPV